jgi:hypothetical protein
MNVDGCEKRMNEGCKNIIHLFLSGIHPFCMMLFMQGCS